MKIIIAGYPYVRENFRKTFDYYPRTDDIHFILPNRWKIKRGKYEYSAASRKNITKTTTLFHHSHYPVIGGLFKGLMPFLPLHLIGKRKFEIYFSATEPTLLSTLYHAFWARFFGLKHIFFTWENVDYDKKFRGASKIVHGLIIRATVYLSDGAVCGNKKAQKILEKKFPSLRTAVIPLSGIDPIRFSPSDDSEKKILKNNLGLAGKTVFLFAGAIGYRKGLDGLIDAFAEIAKEDKDTMLILIGSGEYENQLSEKIIATGISENILRKSWVNHEELINFLKVSDVFVYPSLPYGGWEEQFGYSIAEASLMELPVVSTNSGSIEEVVDDGVTGILVEPAQTQILAEAMRELKEKPEMRSSMGRNGRKQIIEKYSYKTVAKKYSRFFESICIHD